MREYEEIYQLGEWCYSNLRAVSSQIAINNIHILSQTGTNPLSDEVCEKISQNHKGIYKVFFRTDSFGLWSPATIRISESLPFDHVTFECDDETYYILMKFQGENIYFPDKCFPSKRGLFEKYHIVNHSFSNLSSMPNIETDMLCFEFCSFPNNSLNGLTVKGFNSLVLEYCNMHEFGNGISSCHNIKLLIKDTHVQLKSWNGIPPKLSMLMIGVSPEDDYDGGEQNGPVAIRYNPMLLHTLPKYVKKCGTLVWPFHETEPIPVLNFLIMDCNELRLLYSHEGHTIAISDIIMDHFSEKGNIKINASVLLECQETLIEMGHAEYAKI